MEILVTIAGVVRDVQSSRGVAAALGFVLRWLQTEQTDSAGIYRNLRQTTEEDCRKKSGWIGKCTTQRRACREALSPGACLVCYRHGLLR